MVIFGCENMLIRKNRKKASSSGKCEFNCWLSFLSCFSGMLDWSALWIKNQSNTQLKSLWLLGLLCNACTVYNIANYGFLVKHLSCEQIVVGFTFFFLACLAKNYSSSDETRLSEKRKEG